MAAKRTTADKGTRQRQRTASKATAKDTARAKGATKLDGADADARTGRPSALDEVLVIGGQHVKAGDYFVMLLTAGARPVDARRAAGLSKTTLYRLLNTGKAAKSGKARDFWHRVRRARSQGKTALLAKITGAKDWRAAAWALERMWPEEFGRPLAPPRDERPPTEAPAPFVIERRTAAPARSP